MSRKNCAHQKTIGISKVLPTPSCYTEKPFAGFEKRKPHYKQSSRSFKRKQTIFLKFNLIVKWKTMIFF